MPGVTAASVAATSLRRGSGEPRAAPSPRSHRQLAGSILWLPRIDELRRDCESDLEADRCNHPVVVLSPRLEDGRVVYLMMTSLRGADLESRFLHNSNLRREYLPIRPCRPHPDNGILLSLEDVHLELRKKSYVHTKTHHRIHFGSLQPYARNGSEYVLSRRSYQELIEYAKFTPPTAHPSSNTVSSPGVVGWYGQVVPVARERSGSYSEYVSVQRGLESAALSPPRVHHAPVTNLARHSGSTVGREREPLLASSYLGYPRDSHAGYLGSYPATYSSNHPVYTRRASARAGSQSGAPRPRGAGVVWKGMKIIFWITVALLGAYAAYRGISWLARVATQAWSVLVDGAMEVGHKIADFWSGPSGSTVEPALPSSTIRAIRASL